MQNNEDPSNKLRKPRLAAIAIQIIAIVLTLNCSSGSSSSKNNSIEDNDNDGGGTLPITNGCRIDSDSTISPPSIYGDKIEHNGITWYFETAPAAKGQFITGDWWVVGPVTIIFIDPHSTEVNGRFKNGSMINPNPNIGNVNDPVNGGTYDVATQGYDTYAFYSTVNDECIPFAYANELNAALDVNSGNPLVVGSGSSLVSTISEDGVIFNQGQIKTAAILTVLSSAPPANSFRPPYVGSDKSVNHNWSTVQGNLGLLGTLDHTVALEYPTASETALWFSGPWIEHVPGAYAMQTHPTDYEPRYGGDWALRISEAALWLNSNFSTLEKEPLLIGMIQLGIDLYGIAQNGYIDQDINDLLGYAVVAQWQPNGGHDAGRKFPIVFAGAMLSDTNMLNVSTTLSPPALFQEDASTFYVTMDSVNYSEYSANGCGPNDSPKDCGGYTSDMIDMPDWGIQHAVSWRYDTSRWVTKYRQCCNAANWGGFVLSALAMGLRAEWAHDALFDYMDRYLQYEGSYYGIYGNVHHSYFVSGMWDEYRDDYTGEWPMTDWSSINTTVWNMYPEDQ